MNRRYAQTPTKTPTLTGGDDRPAPACADDFAPFDAMLEHKPETPRHQWGRREAAKMCGRCPLTRCGYRIGRVA